MIKPTIHNNGTSPDVLMELWGEVHDRANALHGALLNASPNGRDYYPQGGDAILEATMEHERYRKYAAMTMRYAEYMREAISDQTV